MADSWVKILTISEAKNRWGCYLMALSLNRSAFVGRSGRNLVRSVSLTLTASLLFSGLSIIAIPSAQAAAVTATGTSPSVCNQEVGNASNVAAYRLVGGDCVIEFKNTGSTTWTVPNGVTSVSLLVVGGGGGGAATTGSSGALGGSGIVIVRYAI